MVFLWFSYGLPGPGEPWIPTVAVANRAEAPADSDRLRRAR